VIGTAEVANPCRVAREELPSLASQAGCEGGERREEEHMGGEEDLHQKIIAIICEQWTTPDGYLLGFDIYERLRSEGFEVTHYAVDTVLSRLAASGRITLSIAEGDGLPPGGAVIDEVAEDLCE
jgi:hypothetical protein